MNYFLFDRKGIVYFFLSIIMVCLPGCQTGNSQSVTDIPTINISKDFPKKEISFQDIADMEYIPLETSKDILLSKGARVQYVSKEYVVVYNRLNGHIHLFGRNGKLKYQFNHLLSRQL